MSVNSKIFDSIMINIDNAIDAEVGEKREYNDDTEYYLEQIHEALLEALDLPEDYAIGRELA